MAIISSVNLRKCVIQNDVVALKEILNSYGVRNDGTQIFTDEHRQTLCTLLAYASARAKNGLLDEDFSNELIERVAMLVEVYDFLNAMLTYLDFQPSSKHDGVFIPYRLIDEMHRMFPNDSIYSLTRTMSPEQFMILSELMVLGEFDGLNRKCVAPILLYCYNKEIIPHEICLAYIAMSLMRVDELKFDPFKLIDEDPFDAFKESTAEVDMDELMSDLSGQ